jgi:hypothetical protein
MEKKKIKVVTEKKALEMFNCSRTKFYNDYRPKLTVYKAENGFNVLFSLDQINKLIEKERMRFKNILLSDEIEIIG